jgi:hypothetical protein
VESLFVPLGRGLQLLHFGEDKVAHTAEGAGRLVLVHLLDRRREYFASWPIEEFVARRVA